jgi:long-chain acyl-CoA synthetase
MAAGDVPGFKGNLFRKAVQVKVEKWHATGDNTHFFWDKLVFRKVGTNAVCHSVGLPDPHN